MKNSPLSDGTFFNDQEAAAIEAVGTAAPEATFSDLVKLAQLDPTSDFRFSNLAGIDLSCSDLRGYDFTGADLRGAYGIDVQWDGSTNFASADVGGSIFGPYLRIQRVLADDETASLLRKIGRGNWDDQIVWAATHLQPTGKYHSVAASIVEGLFYRTKDEFLRAELMKYLAPRLDSPVRLKEMLLAALSSEPETSTLFRSTLNLIKRHRMQQLRQVRQTAINIIRQRSRRLPIRDEALAFLLSTGPSGAEERAIADLARSDDDFGRLYVNRVTSKLGEAFELIVRNPEDNSVFGLRQLVSRRMLDQIAIRWLRAERLQVFDKARRPLLQQRGTGSFNSDLIAARASKIDSMWRFLERFYGMEFVRDGRPDQWGPATADAPPASIPVTFGQRPTALLPAPPPREAASGNTTRLQQLVGKGTFLMTRVHDEPGNLDPDVKFLAENTDLSPNQARELIEKHGRDRKKLLEIASTRKAEG